MQTRPFSDGTTLIELLVVLVIVILLSTLAVPNMSGFVDRAGVRAALHELTGDLYQARSLAVREGTRVQLRFVPRSGCADRYELVRMDHDIVMRTVPVEGRARGVCLRSNVSRAFSIDSRGMVVGSARTVFATAGNQKDSIIVSIVGRIYGSR